MQRFKIVVNEYVQLMKPGILTLLLVTTLGAMLIAGNGIPSFGLVLITILGGTLTAGGANVFNCYIDRDIDAKMNRTKQRATASGRMKPRTALIFGITITLAGVLLLGFFANWLAAGLALIGNLYYVFIYTLWLKRTTPHNIVVGGAAGAIPPLVGWAAVTGTLAPGAWILFAIIFYWTPPHFWALALLKQGEYGRVGVPMLPVVSGEQETRKQIFLYTVLLTAVTLLLVPFGMSWIYLVGALALCAYFLFLAWRLLTDPVLPLDYAEHARYLLTELRSLQEAAGARFDLGLLLTRAGALAAACDRLNAKRAEAVGEPAARLNAKLKALSRTLVPLDYTQGDRFDHDPATPQGIYPALQMLRRLQEMPAGSDEARFLEITARRACNRVGFALAQALAIAEGE